MATCTAKHTASAIEMNWRENWYHERGLPYEPPKLVNSGMFRCVGRVSPKPPELERPPAPLREPGDDDEEVAA